MYHTGSKVRVVRVEPEWAQTMDRYVGKTGTLVGFYPPSKSHGRPRVSVRFDEGHTRWFWASEIELA